MLEKRLDELGWYQFEDFVQTLLKAALGPGVEAWGGREISDEIATVHRTSVFPIALRKAPGPSCFRRSLFRGAGAKFIPALKAAV